MKLISLNIWGGKVYEPLIKFLESHSDDVDIFCFQEMFHTESDRIESRGIRANIYDEIKRALPGHKGYFAPAQDGFDLEGKVDFNISTGNATFVRNTIPVLKSGDVFVYGTRNCVEDFKDKMNFPREVLYVQVQLGNQPVAILNFYGLWDGGGKVDTENRLNQSKNVRRLMESFRDSKIILCGDFNLLPTTRSLAMLGKDMRNLIKEYKVTSTRSNLYTKPEKFADYIIVSPDMKVNDFQVLQDEVSDHLPLLLDFE